ncbi:substrate-binding domain-containing protein [Stakelama tenebrarum]|uniref:Phosphate ABC transporter substrate-binding protein n=1 Tax=Stakelama tenebrarum TaxID=2711215 RepID=A0A6G6Y3G2_9SPHN|nr:substrate-binding domain-containing protein [Sphingosinithalassobacter tenebrarum]QIG79484.1 phosphate ABC transporter substrate-binding protein [Sphingosinithalassobacter tenebrarum]
MLGRLALTMTLAATLAACGDSNGGMRTQITAVGSSTVYPFTTRVAEAFRNQDSNRDAPVIESTGTGGGMARFCDGVGVDYPDLVNASRRMKLSEYMKCQNNNVVPVMEIQIGMDGVALAESQEGPSFELTKKDIYLALAAHPMGKDENSARTWHDVNPDLPEIPIQVYGPPSTSGTRDAFAELIMEPGCVEAFPEIEEQTGDQKKLVCIQIRTDGPYIDAGENDNLIVQKLAANPNAIGIFGYSYLEENQDRLRGIPIEGVAPTYETIAGGSYPGARPLFIYVKSKHLNAVPGLKEFLRLYSTMWGPDGDLVKRGLIAAPQSVRDQASNVIEQQIPLDPNTLE